MRHRFRALCGRGKPSALLGLISGNPPKHGNARLTQQKLPQPPAGASGACRELANCPTEACARSGAGGSPAPHLELEIACLNLSSPRHKNLPTAMVPLRRATDREDRRRIPGDFWRIFVGALLATSNGAGARVVWVTGRVGLVSEGLRCDGIV